MSNSTRVKIVEELSGTTEAKTASWCVVETRFFAHLHLEWNWTWGPRHPTMLTLALLLWSLLRAAFSERVRTPSTETCPLPLCHSPVALKMADHQARGRSPELMDALSAAVHASMHRGSVVSMLGDDILINYPPDGKRRSSYSRTLSRRLRRRLPPDPRRAKRYIRIYDFFLLMYAITLISRSPFLLLVLHILSLKGEAKKTGHVT